MGAILPAQIDWLTVSPSQLVAYIYTLTVITWRTRGHDTPPPVEAAELEVLLKPVADRLRLYSERPPGWVWTAYVVTDFVQRALDHREQVDALMAVAALRTTVLDRQWREVNLTDDGNAAVRDQWQDILGRLVVELADRDWHNGREGPEWQRAMFTLGSQPLPVTLGAYRIRVRRRTKGLTQERLAQQLGVDKATVSRWERLERRPASRHRGLLAEILGGSPSDYDHIKELPKTSSDIGQYSEVDPMDSEC